MRVTERPIPDHLQASLSLPFAQMDRELKALDDEQRSEFARVLEREVLRHARRGEGIEFLLDNLPQPLAQQGLECQTMAIINGMIATCSESFKNSPESEIHDLIRRMRDTVRGRSPSVDVNRGISLWKSICLLFGVRKDAQSSLPRGVMSPESDAAMNVDAVARALIQMGQPLERLNAPYNLLELVRVLYSDGGFAVLADPAKRHGTVGHAYTIVPIDKPSNNCIALRLDSLGSDEKRVRPIYLEELISFFVRNYSSEATLSAFRLKKSSPETVERSDPSRIRIKLSN